MKRIRCPKCDEAILFDETKYEEGRILVFECPECHKQFKIRIPRKETSEKHEENTSTPLGKIIVLENAFHFKQEIPLYEGENIIGRFVKGSSANAAIKTVDPSMDTTHSIITISRKNDGNTKFLLRDAPSNTGTFLHNEILSNKDNIIVHDGDIITLGATTLVLRTQASDEEE